MQTSTLKTLLVGLWAVMLVTLVAGAGSTAAAEPAGEPSVGVDPDIPTLRDVVGHDFGADITTPADLARYLEALAAAAPDRTRLVEYARSWEGRPLHYLVIGTPDHVARLDQIRSGMQRLADPRGAGSGELEDLLARQPVTVWLAHGVHGDEISSSDAALLTAYRLLAGGSAAGGLPEGVLVVIDPVQNPDGRARFVHHYRSSRGLVPQPSPIAAERAQAWPGGRTNHYLFDMNRDWFALTQPEVRGRVRAFLEHYPLVYADLHEMGTDASYYFPPPAMPSNPHLPDAQRDLLEALGQGIAAAFDRHGFRYYTREIFDAYYPGYGDTWPALHGAAGMTFETASARGMLGQRSDGSLVRYRDGVERHHVASLATVETAARQRRRLLEAFLAQRRSSGRDGVYALSRERDPGRADKLARLLADQGIEVRRAPPEARVCGVREPAGSYLVSAAQPAGRLAATLLAPDSPADPEFWQEQERRAAKRLPLEIYDVVAWSLPQLFDVPMAACRLNVGRFPVATTPPAPAAPPEATVAYLVPWGTQAAARFLASALRDGVQVRVATEGFVQDSATYPRGTLIVQRSANGPDLPRRIAELARQSRASVTAADGSWMERGIDFGSDRVRSLPAPQVALAWDEPTAVSSAGAWRYLLEQKLGYPVAPVRVRDLGSRWLDQFDVLVLPEGEGYREALGKEATANVARWVRRGGTLIGVGGALEYLAAAKLLSARPERRADPSSDGEAEELDEPDEEEAGDREGGAEAGEDPERERAPGSLIASDEDYRAAVRPQQEPPRPVPGVLVQATADPDHWLSAGLPEQVPVMLTGQRIFTPLRLDQGTNALVFAATEDLVAGGHLWQEVRAQLARKPAVMVQPQERGQVIGFVADPAFRGMMDGLDVLVANAVFFGAALSDPVPPAPPVQ